MIGMHGLPISWLTIAATVALFTNPTDAFSTARVSTVVHRPTSSPTVTIASSTALNLQRPVGGRNFQLEELEDAESACTDILLNSDLTLTVGETDGPRYVTADGTWSESLVGLHSDDQSGDGSNFKRYFSMKLRRTFVGGTEEKDSTDMGEFEYSVERRYDGECYLVGGSTFAMNGDILDVDEIFGERRVGFFNMIDTTVEEGGGE